VNSHPPIFHDQLWPCYLISPTDHIHFSTFLNDHVRLSTSHFSRVSPFSPPYPPSALVLHAAADDDARAVPDGLGGDPHALWSLYAAAVPVGTPLAHVSLQMPRPASWQKHLRPCPLPSLTTAWLQASRSLPKL